MSRILVLVFLGAANCTSEPPVETWLELTPAEVTLPATRHGDTTAGTLTVRNLSELPLHVECTVGLPLVADVAVLELLPFESRPWTVRFTAEAPGPFTATARCSTHGIERAAVVHGKVLPVAPCFSSPVVGGPESSTPESCIPSGTPLRQSFSYRFGTISDIDRTPILDGHGHIVVFHEGSGDHWFSDVIGYDGRVLSGDDLSPGLPMGDLALTGASAVRVSDGSIAWTTDFASTFTTPSANGKPCTGWAGAPLQLDAERVAVLRGGPAGCEPRRALVALRAATGAIEWSRPITDGSFGPMMSDEAGNIYGDLELPDFTCRHVSIDSQGNERWRRDWGDKWPAREWLDPEGYTSSCKGRVLAAYGGRLYTNDNWLVDAATGARLRNYGESTRSRVVMAQGHVVVRSWNQLFDIDPTSGAERWRLALASRDAHGLEFTDRGSVLVPLSVWRADSPTHECQYYAVGPDDDWQYESVLAEISLDGVELNRWPLPGRKPYVRTALDRGTWIGLTWDSINECSDNDAFTLFGVALPAYAPSAHGWVSVGANMRRDRHAR